MQDLFFYSNLYYFIISINFENKFPEITNKPKIIGGYSLSPLFSLYVFYLIIERKILNSESGFGEKIISILITKFLSLKRT